MQLLHAQAKRKDIGKLVFERSCFDVIHYDIEVKIKPSEKFISGINSSDNSNGILLSNHKYSSKFVCLVKMHGFDDYFSCKTTPVGNLSK